MTIPWTTRRDPDPRLVRIVVDDAGLHLADVTGPRGDDVAGAQRPAVRVAWGDVTRVTAFKRDLFSVDLVCLAFDAADGRRVEVDEELPGWVELLDALPRALPGALGREQVLGAVVQPPFATNETVVYSRG